MFESDIFGFKANENEILNGCPIEGRNITGQIIQNPTIGDLLIQRSIVGYTVKIYPYQGLESTAPKIYIFSNIEEVNLFLRDLRSSVGFDSLEREGIIKHADRDNNYRFGENGLYHIFEEKEYHQIYNSQTGYYGSDESTLRAVNDWCAKRHLPR